MKIQQFNNEFWYVVDVEKNITVAICLTKEDAEKKCKENNWKYEIAA